MNSILLFGAQGQLGRALQQHIQALPPHPRHSPDRPALHALTRAQCDLSDSASVAAAIHACRPAVIINAAAYTAVDRAEAEPQTAQAVNAEAVAAMADAAAQTHSWLVHFSTDYVFDGKQAQAYREEDTPRPLSVYGRSKLGGEQAVLGSACRHLVFRTSWLYSAAPGNFLGTILRRLRQDPASPLKIVANAYGTPCQAARIAATAMAALWQSLPTAAGHGPDGLYHLCASGRASWYGYARYATQYAETLGLLPAGSHERLQPIAASDWPAPAPRPLNSQLDNQRFQRQFSLALPDWRDDLRLTLEHLARHPGQLTARHDH